MNKLFYLQAAILLVLPSIAPAQEPSIRVETFDRDPGWDGMNNRSTAFDPREIVQDFGYTADKTLGETPGAIGGTVTPDGVAAYYAKELPQSDFRAPLSASGTVVVEKGAGNTLLGFFNADSVNEWRTPNSMVFRINGRGDFFHVHFEYATSKWRASAGVIGRHDAEADRVYPLEIPSGGVHTWSISYDPSGNDGKGLIVATFDEQRAECALSEGHKEDGATFNRFGILNVVKSADSPGKLWIGSLKINGEAQDLSQDPHWTGLRNRATYMTEEVRPRFNFGYSATHYVQGQAPGEIGGLFFRGDCREAHRLAYYGARLEPLRLDKPIHASGKLALRRAVSDSTTLFGFFNSKQSVQVNPSQREAVPVNVLGFNIEGPSAQGFYVYPVYRFQGGGAGNGLSPAARLIYPDGASHTWTLDYQPPVSNGDAKITLTVDETVVEMPIAAADVSDTATFDRFGFVTPWIDGNGQMVYFDDLEFTEKQ